MLLRMHCWLWGECALLLSMWLHGWFNVAFDPALSFQACAAKYCWWVLQCRLLLWWVPLIQFGYMPQHVERSWCWIWTPVRRFWVTGLHRMLILFTCMPALRLLHPSLKGGLVYQMRHRPGTRKLAENYSCFVWVHGRNHLLSCNGVGMKCWCTRTLDFNSGNMGCFIWVLHTCVIE